MNINISKRKGNDIGRCVRKAFDAKDRALKMERRNYRNRKLKHYVKVVGKWVIKIDMPIEAVFND